MQNHERDVPYCGVDEHVVKSRSPIFDMNALKILCFYIKERYSIHIKKDVNDEEGPWTDDYILHTFKFTNIRREHDRASKWMISHISNSDDTVENRIYKSILFRIYNKADTAELLGIDKIDFSNKSWVEECKYIMQTFEDNNPGHRFFTNAYKTGGIKRGIHDLYPESGHYNYAPLYFVRGLINDGFARTLLDCEDQMEVYNKFLSINGFGRFIAYQMYVDMTYINEFPFSENEFTIAGPGCYYGVQLLTGKDEFDTGFNGMTTEEIVFWMRDNLVDKFHEVGLDFDPVNIFSDLPIEERKLNVMSLENIMCEFSKYYAIYTGVRKGRMKYVPNRN